MNDINIPQNEIEDMYEFDSNEMEEDYVINDNATNPPNLVEVIV